MLIGIVVKNGIVLIDYIILCRERGQSVLHSVVTAGKSRLRPVLMTTATTVLGMIPMAIGGGQGSEMWSPMAIAVIGGLTVSTILTLVLIPVPANTQYKVGIRIKVRTVDTVRPPITAIAIGLHISEPCPPAIAIGIIPRTVVAVVINTGRRRLLPAVTTECNTD